MSVHVSNKRNVCLFCSTTGLAFGPVFASEFDANDFLEWLRENDYSDPRELSNPELALAYLGWQTRQVVA